MALADVDVDEGAARAAVEKILSTGRKAIAVRCDVADEASVAAAVERTVDAFGRLDAAFNNAGVHVAVAETADVDAADFDRVLAINLRGVFLCMKHELRQSGGRAAAPSRAAIRSDESSGQACATSCLIAVPGAIGKLPAGH